MESPATKSSNRQRRAQSSYGTPQTQVGPLESSRTAPPKAQASASPAVAHRSKRASPYIPLTPEVILQHEATDEGYLQSNQQDHINRLNAGLDALGVDRHSAIHQRVFQDQFNHNSMESFQTGQTYPYQQHAVFYPSGEALDSGTSPNGFSTQSTDAYATDAFDSPSAQQWSGIANASTYHVPQDHTQDLVYYIPEQEYYPQQQSRESNLGGIGAQFDSLYYQEHDINQYANGDVV